LKKDEQKALKLFTMAAEKGLPDAQLYLGQIFFQGLGVRRDFKQALKYFQLASQSGMLALVIRRECLSTYLFLLGNILAIYNLAQMHAKGTGVIRNCRFAMALYKNVAERGRWAERFMDAYQRYFGGAIDEAAFIYLFLAEFGYEAAQTNFAYLMDQEETHLFTEQEAYKRAFINWQRAANQDYSLARVKLGDYRYYGLGSDVDLAEAADHYKIAASTHQNIQAMFNLGYMHQHGLGVSKVICLCL
jgi:SEL1 protein